MVAAIPTTSNEDSTGKRMLHPKQLLSLASDRSLLQETALRASDGPFAPPTAICNEKHRFPVAEQFREISIEPDSIVLERDGRNTAPALAVAALKLGADDPDASLLVLPRDHVIKDPKEFVKASTLALAAATDRIVVFEAPSPARQSFTKVGTNVSDCSSAAAKAARASVGPDMRIS